MSEGQGRGRLKKKFKPLSTAKERVFRKFMALNQAISPSKLDTAIEVLSGAVIFFLLTYPIWCILAFLHYLPRIVPNF